MSRRVITCPKDTLIWVKWLDHARSGGSWMRPSDHDAGPIVCESVGWIVRSGEDEGRPWIALAQSKSDQSGNCIDLITVIEGEILEWSEIK